MECFYIKKKKIAVYKWLYIGKIIKFNFCLKNTSDSDIIVSDSRWLQESFVRNEKNLIWWTYLETLNKKSLIYLWSKLITFSKIRAFHPGVIPDMEIPNWIISFNSRWLSTITIVEFINWHVTISIMSAIKGGKWSCRNTKCSKN